MKIKVKSNLILTMIGLIALGSCKPSIKPVRNRVELKEYGITRFYRENFQPKLEPLGLSDLRSGFDSLQLRVWFQACFSDSADVFIIKKGLNGEWLSERMRFPIHLDPFSFRRIASKNGKIIWNDLDSLGINEFNGMDSITIGKYCDGEMAVIEIATKSTYRCCSSQSSLAYNSANDAYEVVKINAFLESLFNGMQFPEENSWRTRIEHPK